MKSIKLFSIITAALTLASCSKEVVQDIDPATIQFTPAIAALRASGSQWVSGDHVGIFMITAGTALTADNIVKEADNRLYEISNAATATFTAAAGQGIKYPSTGEVDFIAYYPHESPLTGYIYPIDVTVQATPADIDLLWAKTENRTKSRDAVPLNFSHKLSKVRVDIVAGEGMQASDFAGMEVTVSGVPATAGFSVADGSTFGNPGAAATITTLGVTASANAAASFEALLIPQGATAGRKLAFTLDCGTYYTFGIPADTELVSGTVSTFTVTLTATDVTKVVTKISPWADGTLPGGELDFGVDEQAIVVDWSGHAGLVEYIEVVGTDGNTYAGKVDGKGIVTGIYALPPAVSSAKIIIKGGTRPINLVAGQFTYAAATGLISINAGAGTAADKPYLVVDAMDLIYIRSNLAKHYIQVLDIDLADYPAWSPIGSGSSRFSGSYDGDGYVIDNMKINSSSNYVGLFSYISGATLKNITIGAGSSVKGAYYVGALCGANQGYILNCINKCNVEGMLSVGGLCGVNGYASTTIEKCLNSGDVKSTSGSYTGGICGSGGIYIDCHNSGQVEGTSTYTGGVCGEAVSVKGCTNSGVVIGQSNYTGGIIGRCTGNISLSTNNGQVTGNCYVAGICGSGYNATIEYCTNNGQVTSSGYIIGGVCGSLDGLTSKMANSINTASITSNYANNSGYVGGLCGYNNGTLADCSNSGEVTGIRSNVGGVCGFSYTGGRIERCINSGRVSVTYNAGANNIAGICGYNHGTAVIACVNSGEVAGAGYSIGGICGYSYVNGGKVVGCINSGRISTSYTNSNQLGGICGGSEQPITACINRGEVVGSGSNVGGICSYSVGTNALINACYSIGKVFSTSSSNVYFIGTNSINYCYWTAATGSTASENVGTNIAFSGSAWPANDAAKNWGLFVNQTSTPVDNGCYWKSLGGWNGGGVNIVYPKLWWEN